MLEREYTARSGRTSSDREGAGKLDVRCCRLECDSSMCCARSKEKSVICGYQTHQRLRVSLAARTGTALRKTHSITIDWWVHAWCCSSARDAGAYRQLERATGSGADLRTADGQREGESRGANEGRMTTVAEGKRASAADASGAVDQGRRGQAASRAVDVAAVALRRPLLHSPITFSGPCLFGKRLR